MHGIKLRRPSGTSTAVPKVLQPFNTLDQGSSCKDYGQSMHGIANQLRTFFSFLSNRTPTPHKKSILPLNTIEYDQRLQHILCDCFLK